MSGTQKTSQECSLMTSQRPTSGASEHLAKTFHLPEEDSGWPETSQSLSGKYFDYCMGDEKKTGRSLSSTRTSMECYPVLEEETSEGYSKRWTKAGMMRSGKLSTLRPMYRSTEREYTLSDILEAKVPDKYFLSPSQLKKILLGRSDS